MNKRAWLCLTCLHIRLGHFINLVTIIQKRGKITYSVWIESLNVNWRLMGRPRAELMGGCGRITNYTHMVHTILADTHKVLLQSVRKRRGAVRCSTAAGPTRAGLDRSLSATDEWPFDSSPPSAPHVIRVRSPQRNFTRSYHCEWSVVLTDQNILHTDTFIRQFWFCVVWFLFVIAHWRGSIYLQYCRLFTVSTSWILIYLCSVQLIYTTRGDRAVDWILRRSQSIANNSVSMLLIVLGHAGIDDF